MLDSIEAMLDSSRVKMALSLITVSKYGLRDSELLDMLSHDPVFHSDTTYRKFSKKYKKNWNLRNYTQTCLFLEHIDDI